jgi:cob(I)alamin adenosyltransferase
MSGKYLFSARGDDGKTGLMGTGRYPKSELRFEVLGTIDEASASIGFAKSLLSSTELVQILTQVQRDLYLMMGEISVEPGKESTEIYICEDKIDWLEKQIHTICETSESPKGFIIPGDSKEDAALDMARTVIRRAERRLVEFMDSGGYNNLVARQYLNRLSSLIFCFELVVHNPLPVTLAKE